MSYSLLQKASVLAFLLVSGCSLPEKNETILVTNVGKEVSVMQMEFSKMNATLPTMKAEYETIRTRITALSQKYVEDQSFILFRLQRGTTRGNPVLLEKLQQVKNQWQSVSKEVETLKNLAKKTEKTIRQAEMLKNRVAQTYEVSGAVDEDHDKLRSLEKDLGSFLAQTSVFSTHVNNTIAPEEAYLTLEKNNLHILTQAVAYGYLDARKEVKVQPVPVLPADKEELTVLKPVVREKIEKETLPEERPLMEIRFDENQVRYEAPLMQVIRKVLEKKPDAEFRVVTRSAGKSKTPRIRRETVSVFKILLSLGISSESIDLLSETDGSLTADEILIFIK